MTLVRVDTQRAYELIWDMITTLTLAPGAAINEQELAEGLQMGLVPVQEALKLLAHDDLVIITPRHGLYVAPVESADLDQLSEIRLPLEALGARLAAERAAADDLVVLEALCHEQAELPPDDEDSVRRLFALDHKFHQAIAAAANNKYLARTLEHFFGLSRRLWFMALPRIDFLSTAVEDHLELVAAIKAGDADRAEAMMRRHVGEFYEKVHAVLGNDIDQ